MGLSKTNNIEDLLQLASEFGFTQEFMDLLWVAREDISTGKLEIIWQNLVENMEDNNLLPIPEEYGEEEAEEYSDSKMCFFVNLIAENDRLLTQYFENNRGNFFKQCIFINGFKMKRGKNSRVYCKESNGF